MSYEQVPIQEEVSHSARERFSIEKQPANNHTSIRMTNVFVTMLIGSMIAFLIYAILKKTSELKVVTTQAASDANSTKIISKRASTHFLAPGLSYAADFFSVASNPYSATNPSGGLPLAVAENKLTQILLMNKLNQFTNLSFASLNYWPAVGSPRLRNAIATLLQTRVFKLPASSPPVSADNLCVSAGVTAILNQLSLTLFDASDALLVPVPYYAAFDSDFGNLGDVKIVGVQSENDDGTIGSTITNSSLNKAFKLAQSEGYTPRALLLTNPNNPLGTIYSTKELLLAVQWTREQGMHLICDEIYALSVFGSGAEFVSLVSVLDNNLGDYVHILWGMSKDFGASGLRVGALYTQNKLLLTSIASNLGWAFVSSNIVQEMSAFVLEDQAFLDNYIPENQSRLRKSYQILEDGIAALNINMFQASAAIFCVVDLRSWLKTNTWEAEHELYVSLVKHGVVLTPGKDMHAPIPGYFRICYAWVLPDALQEFLKRLQIVSTYHALTTR